MPETDPADAGHASVHVLCVKRKPADYKQIMEEAQSSTPRVWRAAFDDDEAKRRGNDDETRATPGLRKLAAPRETFGTATSTAQHDRRKRKKTGPRAGKTEA
ncbi:hypothetical protein E2562_017596 [Oryza meyeriana var. granulata]|uniref:Uncharacterized protein n=1 Tax=Oryza meyeriana var. granulata TaxID=110450 RepID=A0A6G1BLG4_9ORYZ|nr:hypothetical protein E2562_017596 [Oryza meyeriana var. granulata]